VKAPGVEAATPGGRQLETKKYPSKLFSEALLPKSRVQFFFTPKKEFKSRCLRVTESSKGSKKLGFS
jgi:hypothetical protein